MEISSIIQNRALRNCNGPFPGFPLLDERNIGAEAPPSNKTHTSRFLNRTKVPSGRDRALGNRESGCCFVFFTTAPRFVISNFVCDTVWAASAATPTTHRRHCSAEEEEVRRHATATGFKCQVYHWQRDVAVTAVPSAPTHSHFSLHVQPQPPSSI